MSAKIAIVEDNKALRNSFIELFKIYIDYELVGIFPDANNIEKNIQECNPDVVLMDIQMPGINGIQAVKILKAKFPDLKIIIQTVFEDENYIFEAICSGASGYLLKKSSPDEYIAAINDVINGGAPMTGSIAKKVLSMFKASHQKLVPATFDLSEREIEILQHLVKGLGYKMIADKCNISYNTVRFHMKNIYSKLQVESMTEAVSLALKNNIV